MRVPGTAAGWSRCDGRHVGRHDRDLVGETAVTGHHLPALNGLRGLAVIGVVAYHLQLGWASGGYLGVDLFFVLSGFLITTLLLEEWVGTGRINLAAFWGRRAKRLLPALFLVVVALALYLVCNALFGGPGANGLVDLSGLRGEAIATLLYVNNWHAIFAHQSYFAQFSTPSPLQHTWSLAIEEQFYLVWPLVLLVLRALRAAAAGAASASIVTVTLGVRVLGAHGGPLPPRSRIPPASTTAPTPGSSTSWRARPSPSWPPSRPQPNAAGAPRPARGGARPRPWPSACSGSVPARSGGLPTNFMFEGGFLLCAALAALVVADARLIEPGRFSRALAWGPLHFIGTISYGIYLWHWPVIVYLNGSRTGLSAWPLTSLRIAVTLGAVDGELLPGRAADPPGHAARRRGWAGAGGRRRDRGAHRGRHHPGRGGPVHRGRYHAPASSGTLQAVPGAGGYAGQQPIRLAPPPSAADPLRVMVLGDSVMHDASYGITAVVAGHR